MDSKQIIQQLDLEKHPEGGYFREIYRSDDVLSFSQINKGHAGLRNLATSIYYLLEYGQFSKLHRLKSDEIWYFHGGGPMLVVVVYKGQISTLKLGLNLQQGEVPQIILKAGSIFGATSFDKNSFTLVGCMVTPGFDFSDFEFVDRSEILRAYPEYTNTLDEFL